MCNINQRVEAALIDELVTVIIRRFLMQWKSNGKKEIIYDALISKYKHGLSIDDHNIKLKICRAGVAFFYVDATFFTRVHKENASAAILIYALALGTGKRGLKTRKEPIREANQKTACFKMPNSRKCEPMPYYGLFEPCRQKRNIG